MIQVFKSNTDLRFDMFVIIGSYPGIYGLSVRKTRQYRATPLGNIIITYPCQNEKRNTFRFSMRNLTVGF